MKDNQNSLADTIFSVLEQREVHGHTIYSWPNDPDLWVDVNPGDQGDCWATVSPIAEDERRSLQVTASIHFLTDGAPFKNTLSIDGHFNYMLTRKDKDPYNIGYESHGSESIDFVDMASNDTRKVVQDALQECVNYVKATYAELPVDDKPTAPLKSFKPVSAKVTAVDIW